MKKIIITAVALLAVIGIVAGACGSGGGDAPSATVGVTDDTAVGVTDDTSPATTIAPRTLEGTGSAERRFNLPVGEFTATLTTGEDLLNVYLREDPLDDGEIDINPNPLLFFGPKAGDTRPTDFKVLSPGGLLLEVKGYDPPLTGDWQVEITQR